ncbi:MAG: bifunctional glutamate N-acetyltransferase/amino-acid acetyltransferase ArgJ [Chitinispirillaceae bacterium]|jgi:glutamate N-acetyltransferase/amino-acid N-acetyltransferase
MKKSLKNLVTVIPGGVTQARGFRAAGIHAGIKENGGDDLALLASDTDCTAAGTFTTNAIKASSVDWCEKLLPSDTIRAIVANSGCANACTGLQGEKDTALTAELAGISLHVPPESLLVASTGMIGKFLPMEKIAEGLRAIVPLLATTGGSLFARAVMTTDTVKKESAVRVKLMSGNVVIGGCVKGSGMICPNMATMLAFITTDAKIPAGRLSTLVKRTVDRTFNNLTIDGDTSTNDMVLVLANGASGLAIASEPEVQVFEEGLFAVCSDLCRKIAADGEGATKRVEITVRGAASEAGAKKAAKAVANSNLTKCALFGNDPNWGRIACAIGYSGAAFSREKMSISLCGVPVFKNLQPMAFDEKKLSKLLSEKVVTIDINLGCGEKSAVAHTCDFSYDYVKINAEYHT